MFETSLRIVGSNVKGSRTVVGACKGRLSLWSGIGTQDSAGSNPLPLLMNQYQEPPAKASLQA